MLMAISAGEAAVRMMRQGMYVKVVVQTMQLDTFAVPITQMAISAGEIAILNNGCLVQLQKTI